MMKFAAALVAAFLLPGAAEGQQRSDLKYAAHVTRPAYSANGPVVAVDEAHRNFHTLEGRYSAFGKLLAADGYRLWPFTGPFSAQTLHGLDVLVISNAASAAPGMSAFGSDEIAAVREWVSGGGSLLLISDHAPFGTAASRLAEAFGVNMGVGFVAALEHGKPSSQIEFGRRGLGRHAILDGRDSSERIKSVESFTGQSLSIPAGATALLLLSDDALEVERLEQLQALERGERVPARSVAGRAQAIALPFGKGRVVVAGEAAMFTEQSIPGVGRVGLRDRDDQQFTLNVLHWLSHLIG